MAECASLCLVEHGAKNFIVNAPCVVESFLHRVDLRATPLDDENIQSMKRVVARTSTTGASGQRSTTTYW